MTTFSQTLIEKTKRYFLIHWGKVLSDEEADAYIDSLAGLFLAFAGEGSDGREKPP